LGYNEAINLQYQNNMVDTEIVAQEHIAEAVEYNRNIRSVEKEYKAEILNESMKTLVDLLDRAENVSLIINNANKTFDDHSIETKPSKVLEGVKLEDSKSELLESDQGSIDGIEIFEILKDYFDVDNIQTYESEVGESKGVLFSTSKFMYKIDSDEKHLRLVKSFFKDISGSMKDFKYLNLEMVEYLLDKKLETTEEIMSEVGKYIQDTKPICFIEGYGDPYNTGGKSHLHPQIFLIQPVELKSDGIIQEFIRVAEDMVDVEEIGLPVQINQALTRGGIYYLHQLIGMDEKTLQEIRGIGPSYSKVILQVLKGLEKEG
jgi:hypothetical protein